jgi:FG-GAP-like repeat/Lectin C-type domain
MPPSSSDGAARFSIRRVSVLLVATLFLSGITAPRPAGASSQISFLPVASYPGAGVLPTADLDGDGTLDLIIETAGILSIRYGNGDGSFGAPVDLSLTDGLNGVATADFNHDGALDLAIANISTNQLLVLLNRGHRTFALAGQYAVGDGPTGVAAADFNGDGAIDLAVSSHRSSNLCVLLNRGDGTFQPAVFYPGGDHPGAMITADFNGDGKADLAMANIVGSSVLLYFGTGTGKFSVGDNYPVGQYSGQLVAGDFNRDGKLDLVTTNWMGSSMSVLFGDGRGKFRAAEFYPANSYPGMVAAADLDGDGDLDLAFSNGGTGDFTVLQNNGSGQFLPPVTFDSGGSDARSLTVGDFNRDGRPDVAVGNSSTATILVLLNAPSAPPPTGPSTPPQDAATPVYDPANGHWYQAVQVSSPITWQEARVAAAALVFAGQPGHLVTITSAKEQEFVASNLPVSRELYWWMGAYQDKTAPDYREPTGGWRWVTGEPWGFTHWYPNEPNNDSNVHDVGENAAEFDAKLGSFWNDYPNLIRIGGYIVEYDTAAVPSGPASPPQFPWPPVYNPANGHWYQEVEVPGGIAWQGANRAAQADFFVGLTGHLATMTSGEENQFMLNNLPHAVQGNWWLGAYQDTTAADAREPAGGWRWVTGEPWAFTNWQVGEPDNVNGGEDRLHLLNNGRWNDAAISSSLGGYVVEYDMPAEYGAPTLSMVEIVPDPVSGGLLTTGQVTLTAPAGPGGMTVTLSSSDPAVASPVKDRILIYAGSISGTFKIRTTRRTSAAYLTISATANGITRSRELTVYP